MLHDIIIFTIITKGLTKFKKIFFRYCHDPQNIPLYLSKRPQDLPSGGPKKCSYCGGHVSCELQILPTLINSLKLQTNSEAATVSKNIQKVHNF